MKREILEPVPNLMQWFERMQEGQAAPTPPADGLIEWYEDGVQTLLAVLRTTNPDEPMWSWSGNNRAAHYQRMMPIETALHRWDAELAHGRVEPIEMELARDGIDQNFDVMLQPRRPQGPPRAGEGETFEFLTADVEGTWRLRFDGNDVAIHPTSAPVDVTVRGIASDLFLFLWHRLPPESLDVTGNPPCLNSYFELVPPL